MTVDDTPAVTFSIGDPDPKFLDAHRLISKLKDGDSETADYLLAALDFLIPERDDYYPWENEE